MKGCKYCKIPNHDILTFAVGEDKDGYEIMGHIDCDGQGLRYFDDIYEGGMCERVNINFCPMCGRDMRNEDEWTGDKFQPNKDNTEHHYKYEVNGYTGEVILVGKHSDDDIRLAIMDDLYSVEYEEI